MSFKRHCCRPCGEKTIVHPTRCNQTQSCSESIVNHVHPSHTNHLNTHFIRNRHFFPHTTSQQNRVVQLNEFGGSGRPPVGGPGFNQGGAFGQGFGFNQGGAFGQCGPFNQGPF